MRLVLCAQFGYHCQNMTSCYKKGNLWGKECPVIGAFMDGMDIVHGLRSQVAVTAHTTEDGWDI